MALSCVSTVCANIQPSVACGLYWFTDQLEMTVPLSLHRANCWFEAFAGLQAGQRAHTDALDYDLCLSNTRVTSPSDLDPAFKAANTWPLRTASISLQQCAEPVYCSTLAIYIVMKLT